VNKNNKLNQLLIPLLFLNLSTLRKNILNTKELMAQILDLCLLICLLIKNKCKWNNKKSKILINLEQVQPQIRIKFNWELKIFQDKMKNIRRHKELNLHQRVQEYAFKMQWNQIDTNQISIFRQEIIHSKDSKVRLLLINSFTVQEKVLIKLKSLPQAIKWNKLIYLNNINPLILLMLLRLQFKLRNLLKKMILHFFQNKKILL